MFEKNDSRHEDEENRHSAASEKNCKNMEKKYGWKLKRVEPTNNPILPVDCIFEGKQTSFQDQWDDHQD
ncbi:MAG TPA: hypothetical protein DCL61_22030 [Cyanobacteria bacterium UBA12227]|nr:hypothetical protein [Cyanobacteria bacterium UBA12227]HAX85287.1 hypothetical protein [Cyanobacteria bacterium UBA11370]HBY79926.1 hypothetical protein [Cyanobacteria bacterium UBA11148]